MTEMQKTLIVNGDAVVVGRVSLSAKETKNGRPYILVSQSLRGRKDRR